MNVLQIANGYIEKGLYRNLFAHLKSCDVYSQVFVPVKKGYSHNTEESNVRVIECFNSLDRYLYFSKQWKTINALEKSYDLSSFDIIHAHTLFSTGYSAYKINKKYGIKYVVAIRNTDVNLFLEKFYFFRRIGLTIMLNSSKIVFLSPKYRDAVIQKYIPEKYKKTIYDKSIIVPNGIDDYFFLNQNNEPHAVHDPLRIIHIGDIDNNKNVLTTIKAIEYLINNGQQITYFLIGEIKDPIIKDNIISKNFIEICGKKSKEEIVLYLRDSDIFVMPSHHETFGLVYGEAMSQGVPVIYTRGQGFDGQFDDGVIGYSVNDNDFFDISSKILSVIENYKELQSNCFNLVNKFNWQIIAEKYADIYNNIVNK